MFQRLLICTSLSDGLQRLVHFVPSLAAGGIQHITFLHVLPVDGRGIPRVDEAKVQQVKEQLSVAKADLPSGVEVEVEVQAGRTDERIAAVAKANQIDLIVLGSESRSLLTEKLFGSTAVALCQSSLSPILILRPQLISVYTVEELDLRCRHLLRYFLMPYDGGKAAEYLLAQVKKYAERRPPSSLQECLLFHVIEDSDRIEKLLLENRIKEAAARLATAKTDLESTGLQVNTKIVLGEPIPETLKAALEYDITAIATASATMGKFAEWSGPSFTGELIRRSWHPILFFPPVQ
ncbi:universal stress protein [Leptolyngbya sp. NK1-12]|uniref:Universal stress protein n=1 Tax=Leptolyngbya sp. NK1-12 TaxID=2547451 RepID=A0AA96WI38_9CYAN|nr:universal stress protein [Leptolyngbya sp. NK1-12]WNZ25928.1 universal stress protein [Leptolyngbya sp. NK1-12]